AVPPDVKASLEAKLKTLADAVAALDGLKSKKPNHDLLVPDVEIYAKAVHYALAYGEFFDKKEFTTAELLLDEGLKRAKSLAAGDAPWTRAVGLVVRGYRSKIDGSVQPYGLIVPKTFSPNAGIQHRLDFWCHGRGETLSELNFIHQRSTSPGEFKPAGAFVLHPYGRYCNANKFAGEIDMLESLEHAKNFYPIDDDRVVMRGFSMGGAACWQFAVHYTDLFAAAAPGAGFSEPPDFLKVFQKETLKPTWYEQKLWRWYDATESALNLSMCPTVAYSGEKDSQKQAADLMDLAFQKEGMKLVHLVGPDTGHQYHPQTRDEIDRRIDALAAVGRNPFPQHVRFVTYTLRYPKMYWVEIDALEKHWEKATIDAVVYENSVSIKTEHVKAFTIRMPVGRCPFDPLKKPEALVDANDFLLPPANSDRSWTVH
ncbi:MAG: prolyl oligopeptidase family serine peptidase, partial [Planctomycetia bacterium]